jgi:hypothetical protein
MWIDDSNAGAVIFMGCIKTIHHHTVLNAFPLQKLKSGER